jgi:small neutral amino acid transporter SnatA (MarC family)
MLEGAMLRMTRVSGWPNRYNLRAAAMAALVLFSITYVSDAVLYYLGIAVTETIVDDAAIAISGSTVLVFFLVQNNKNQIVARAKERAIIVAEVNHHVRNAMTPLALVMTSPDTGERLRILDMATDRVDHVLTDLLPTVGTASKPRFY